jgi:hypothetical protein
VIELNDVKIESFSSYYHLDDMHVLLNDEKNTHTHIDTDLEQS